MKYPKINIILGIIGRISSGKSTIAKRLAEHYGAEIISFSKYLVDYSKRNGLETDRNALQELGEQFIKMDARAFLYNVINSQASYSTKLVIIEGIRHKIICKAIKGLSDKAIFSFIDVPLEVRHERYCSRSKESDEPVSMEKFNEIDSHRVEAEIDSLKSICTITLKSDLSDYQLFELFDARMK